VTWFELFAAWFLAEILTVLSCDDFSNPDISRKFFPSVWISKKKSDLGFTSWQHRTDGLAAIGWGFDPQISPSPGGRDRM